MTAVGLVPFDNVDGGERLSERMIYGLIAGLTQSKALCTTKDPWVRDAIGRVCRPAAKQIVEHVVQAVDSHDASHIHPWLSALECERLTERIDGPFIDLMCDACDLSPSSRVQKWNAEDEALRAERELHMRRQNDHSATVTNMRRVRHENSFAHSILCGGAQTRERGTVDDRPEVSLAYAMSLEHLASKPPSFWWGMRLLTLSDIELRSALHRVQLLTSVHGAAHVPRSFRTACSERLLELTLEPEFDPGRHASSAESPSAHRACCWLWKRSKKQSYPPVPSPAPSFTALGYM